VQQARAAIPRRASRVTRAMSVGVLPVPPIVRLPTQITGTPTRAPGRASWRRVAVAQEEITAHRAGAAGHRYHDRMTFGVRVG